MVSFAVQNVFNLVRSHLFVFIPITLGDRLKKNIPAILSESVLPIFSSKNFMVSSLAFRSLIHFELIFVHGIKNILISFFHM